MAKYFTYSLVCNCVLMLTRFLLIPILYLCKLFEKTITNNWIQNSIILQKVCASNL